MIDNAEPAPYRARTGASRETQGRWPPRQKRNALIAGSAQLDDAGLRVGVSDQADGTIQRNAIDEAPIGDISAEFARYRVRSIAISPIRQFPDLARFVIPRYDIGAHQHAEHGAPFGSAVAGELAPFLGRRIVGERSVVRVEGIE